MSLNFGFESLAHHPLLLAALILFAVLSYRIPCTGISGTTGGEQLKRLTAALLSPPINFYLSRSYAVYGANDSSRQLPGCPYVWPNGQGDVAKFLFGKENSAVWRRAYGSVYRIWSGTNPEIVISHPEDIRTVFRDSHRHAKAPANHAGRLMHELLGQCLGLINKDDWRSVRAVVEPPFRAPCTAAHLPVILAEIRAHLAAQLTDPTSNLAAGRLDPVGDLKFVPFWIVASILYGHLDDMARAELENMIPLRERLWGRMLQGGVVRFGWSRWLPWLAANRELREWKRRWMRFNRRRGTDASAASSAGGDKHELSPVAHMYSALVHGELSEDQLLQTLDEMLFANLDVTMGGVSWNFVFLAAHSDIQAKLRDELRESCPDIESLSSAHKDVDADTVDTASSTQEYLLSTTNLLHACMLEASRLRPLAAFSVPQSAPTARVVCSSSDDTEFSAKSAGSAVALESERGSNGSVKGPAEAKTEPGGHRVPSGTSFIIDTHTLNLRDPFWGDGQADRTAYQPQRWLQRTRQDYRYRYWRFGFGPRQCLGRYVADAVIKSMVAAVVQDFDLALPPGEEGASWDRDAATWIMHPTVLLQCTRRHVGGGVTGS